MKTNIIIILLFLASAAIVAQEAEIVVENKQWSVVQENCLPEGNFYTTIYQRFEGDTLINNRLYKKVLIAEDELYQEWFFNGYFVREDSGRVYLREYLGDEGLIYDFNLAIGDTISIDNPLAPDKLHLTLTTIDSIETTDGYRKRWRFEKDEYSPPEYWIEGIGSLSGILHSGTGVFGPLCGAFTLLCEMEDDVTVYQNPEYGTCYYVLLDVNEGSPEEETLFKIKRSGGDLLLSFKDNNTKLVRITSLSGTVVYNNETAEHEIRLSGSVFSKGFYVISALQNHKHYTQKVIIY